MNLFEIFVLSSTTSANGGPFVSDDRLMYAIPPAAETLLEPILDRYGQDPKWYFDKLNFGKPPAPWALVCLDREYAIAGHIATARPADSGITFTTYEEMPTPIPSDFVPAVATLVFHSKEGLRVAVDHSPVFSLAWKALRDCSTSQHWLAVLEPLSTGVLAGITKNDRELWLQSRK